ncbi:MAG: trk system potassium uptake protein TrkA [Salibacteraceae bacterium]|jgi:trk system potassium uptake protein TrkA
MGLALHRNGKITIPRGDTLIKKGDDYYFIAHKKGIQPVLNIIRNKSVAFKNIMPLGRSKIAEKTCKVLCKDYSVKLVEQNKEKAFELSDKLNNVLIIHGDYRG